MVTVLVLGVAMAGPSGDASTPTTVSPPCWGGHYLGAAPAPGAVGVPLDAVVTFVFLAGTLEPECAAATLDGPQGVVDAEVAFEGDLVVLRPVGDLEPGTEYVATLWTPEQTVAVDFATGDGSPQPGPAAPTATTLDLVPNCSTTFEAQVYATATFDAAPPASGVLEVVAESEGVGQAVAAWPLGGDTFVELSGFLGGVRDTCASVRVVDLAGRTASESAEVCAAFTCSAPEPSGEPTITAHRDCTASMPADEVTLELDVVPASDGGSFVGRFTSGVGIVEVPMFNEGGARVTLSAYLDPSISGEVCGSVAYVDPWGDEVWRTAEVCTPGDGPCPWEDDLDGVASGCGCSGTAPSGGGVALLLVTLLARRRAGEV